MTGVEINPEFCKEVARTGVDETAMSWIAVRCDCVTVGCIATVEADIGNMEAIVEWLARTGTGREMVDGATEFVKPTVDGAVDDGAFGTEVSLAGPESTAPEGCRAEDELREGATDEATTAALFCGARVGRKADECARDGPRSVATETTGDWEIVGTTTSSACVAARTAFTGSAAAWDDDML